MQREHAQPPPSPAPPPPRRATPARGVAATARTPRCSAAAGGAGAAPMVSKSANKPTRSQPARFLSRTANLGPWLALGFYDRGFYDTEDYCI